MIHDLTVKRLRQLTSVIQQRQWVERFQRRQALSWQTRTLAQFIAGTVPVDPKTKANPLADAAASISIDPAERKHLETVSPADRSTKASVTAPGENRPGSYEFLMRGFRAPPPQAQ